MGDKSGLLALKQHFKHVSITMTDRYVGRDLELLDLVATEKQQQIGLALEGLIGADRLAGKLGEQIVARNERFRGRAGGGPPGLRPDGPGGDRPGHPAARVRVLRLPRRGCALRRRLGARRRLTCIGCLNLALGQRTSRSGSAASRMACICWLM